MKYYIAVNDHHEGPFDIAQLKARHITPSTLVWNEMMSGWTPAGDVPYLVENCFNTPPSVPAPPVAAPVSSRQAERPTAPKPAPEPQPAPQPAPAAPQYDNRPEGLAPRSNNGQIPPRPRSWLVPAILATIFCCLPLGIFSIVYASKVNKCYDEGDYEGAERASVNARNWLIGAMIGGVIYIAVSLLLGYLVYIDQIQALL